MCLAMNERISADEFLELSRQRMEQQQRLFETALDCAAQLPVEQRVQYLVTVMPIVCTL